MQEPNIVYEDNHIIVAIKPQNISVQEDESKDPDMLTIIKDFIKRRDNKPGNVFLGLVHRLDRPTGGVMVFAKTSKAASRLSEQLKNKDLRKNCGNFEAPIYLILVADMKKAASEHFAKIDTGYVSMNIYLACGALNLGTCAIGSFDRNKAAYATLLKELNFSKDMRVLLTHCVGVPK